MEEQVLSRKGENRCDFTFVSLETMSSRIKQRWHLSDWCLADYELYERVCHSLDIKLGTHPLLLACGR